MKNEQYIDKLCRIMVEPESVLPMADYISSDSWAVTQVSVPNIRSCIVKVVSPTVTGICIVNLLDFLSDLVNPCFVFLLIVPHLGY